MFLRIAFCLLLFTISISSVLAEKAPEQTYEKITATIGNKEVTWLPHVLSVLMPNRPINHKVENVGVIENSSGQQYFVLHTAPTYGDRNRHHNVEIHKVSYDATNNVRLKYLRTFSEFSISNFSILKGHGVNNQEETILYFETWAGGSHPSTEAVKLVLMEHNSVDITPDKVGKVVKIHDFNDDGISEYVMQRWHHFPDIECFRCLNSISSVLKREKGKFLFACEMATEMFNEHADKYLSDGKEHHKKFISDERVEGYPYEDEITYNYTNAVLRLLQNKNYEKAKAVLKDINEVRKQPFQALNRFIDLAVEHQKSSCPASDVILSGRL